MGRSQRLRTIAALVPPCRCVADIGCDHGSLVELVLEAGTASKAIAADASAPSLAKARRRLGGYACVDFRLGDGLHVVRPHEADVICICGMGGLQIMRILAESPLTAQSSRALILGAHRSVPDLRRFLRASGYAIMTERVVEERGHFYELQLAAPGDDRTTDPFWNDVARIEGNDPVYAAYLRHMLTAAEGTAVRLQQAGQDNDRLAVLQARTERLRGMLEQIAAAQFPV